MPKVPSLEHRLKLSATSVKSVASDLKGLIKRSLAIFHRYSSRTAEIVHRIMDDVGAMYRIFPDNSSFQ